MADDINIDALAQQIADNAALPQSTSFDGTTVQERSIADQIAAVEFFERRQAVRRFPLGQPIKVNRPDALG